MGAGLQGHIGSGTSGGLTGCTQCVDFCMRLSGLMMPPLTHYVAILHHHTPYIRIGMGGVLPLRRQLNGPAHVVMIRCAIHSFLQPGYLFTKLADIGKTPVDRGKADVGHLIEPLELFHHQITDKLGIHFPLTGGAHL